MVPNKAYACVAVPSLFKLKTWNPALAWAGLASFIATTLVIEVPFLSNAFGFTAISLHEYLIAIGLAICVIPIVEIVKFFQRRFGKHAA